MIEADHPPEPTPPGQLSSELTFGRNLIGFSEKQEERVKIATVQATLLELGLDVGKIDGKLGPKTTKAIKAFQKKQHMKADGKITEKLLEQLKVAVERMEPADPSQPERASEQ
jgi:murein L,D-transpeptidase YcbB/YkuD